LFALIILCVKVQTRLHSRIKDFQNLRTTCSYWQGRSRSRKESDVNRWSCNRIPNYTRNRSRICLFDVDSGSSIGSVFLHRTPKFGIPVEMVQFLLRLFLKQNSSCVLRFPLSTSCYKIVDSRNHSLYVKES